MQLKPFSKYVAGYLFTGPQTNRIGLYHFSLGMATEDTGLSTKEFASAIGPVFEILKWRLDVAAKTMYLPSWWKHNQPKNENILVGNLADLQEIKDGPLVQAFIRNTEFLPHHCVKRFIECVSHRITDNKDLDYVVLDEAKLGPVGPRNSTLNNHEITLNNHELSSSSKSSNKTLPPLPPKGTGNAKDSLEGHSTTAVTVPAGVTTQSGNQPEAHSTEGHSTAPSGEVTTSTVPSAKRKAKADPEPATKYDESWGEQPWPSVRKFIHMHNTLTAKTWPALRLLDSSRKAKIQQYLKEFTDIEFWGEVFARTHDPGFLQTYRNRGMDWLLTVGKDGTANVVKVHERKYGEDD